MFLTAALTVGGSVLLGLAARKDDKNPFFVLGGLALLGIAVFMRLTGTGPLLDSVGFAAAELGAGLLIIAGMVAGKKEQARSFFMLGMGSMVLGVVIILLRGSMFSSSEQVTLLVELGPDDSYEEIAAVVEAHQGVAERAFPMVDLAEDEDLAQVYLIRLPKDCREALRKILDLDTENVDHTELNPTFSLDLPATEPIEEMLPLDVLENDPLVGSQWALEAIRGHEAHALLQDAEPVRKAVVAIVDTGVDASHEDVSSVFGESPGSRDRHGHGSHCAGIAGATTNNGLGVASLNWEGRFVTILGFSALGDNGLGTAESTAEGIISAAEAGADVISLSLGGQSPITPKVMVDAVKFARKRGAVVIAAAGNSNIDAKKSVPSNIEGVIAVGAVNERLAKAPFSNTNSSLSRPISAPGTNILSLRPGGGYVKLSGTSMATPMVSGLAGVLRALNPELTADEVYGILKDSGRSVAGSGTVGTMIDAEQAVRSVLDA
ncbi:MAG: S8 family serine peptidase [Rhodothermales bacterium]|nr:S8 family serine peptidase [Rhodothermales bacterium]MBO6780420.1 S8 family serine peptidase [Rhodothermales bacterium]